jgi:5-carboxymethyl-2-hydroxymuconic-semialdehyde dehydrogenase
VPAPARIFQEEIFGPVAALTPFDDEAEAITLANDVKYGLAGYVWTRDLTRGHRVGQAIEAGMVWLNWTSTGGPAPCSSAPRPARPT